MKTLLLAWCLALTGPAFVAAAETYQIAVIPKGTTHEFWKSVHAGAVKAERELNAGGKEVVHVIWQGLLKEDDREQHGSSRGGSREAPRSDADETPATP